MRKMTKSRRMRRESRAASSYHGFLEEVCAFAPVGLAAAEAGAASVLYTLEQRMPIEEALDLEAQLPSRLRDMLEERRALQGWWQHRFDREEYLKRVADDLGIRQSEAARLVRAVFGALKRRVSEGEMEDVAAGLPESLALLWRHPEDSYAPAHPRSPSP